MTSMTAGVSKVGSSSGLLRFGQVRTGGLRLAVGGFSATSRLNGEASAD